MPDGVEDCGANITDEEEKSDDLAGETGINGGSDIDISGGEIGSGEAGGAEAGE